MIIFKQKIVIEYLGLLLSINAVNIECFFLYLINISYCNSWWCVAGLWEGVRYSVIVSFGVVVSLSFPISIVKGIFGAYATYGRCYVKKSYTTVYFT